MDIQKRNRHFYAAVNLEKRGSSAKALESYREALKIDPRFMDAWLNSGVVFSRLKRSDKAIRCYETALKNGFDDRILYNLALELYKHGDPEKAVHLLNSEAHRIESIFQCRLLLAYSYGRISEFAKSEKTLLSLLNSATPESEMEILGALILLYYKIGDVEKCEAFAKKALRHDPAHPISMKVLRFLHSRQDETLSKMHELRKTVESDPFLKEAASLLQDDPALADKISEKQKRLAAKEKKTPKDRLDLSLLALFLGEGEEAIDQLLAASIEPVPATP